MKNTRNLKDIGKLNVYEIVQELKGVSKKYRHIYALSYYLSDGSRSYFTVITGLGSL